MIDLRSLVHNKTYVVWLVNGATALKRDASNWSLYELGPKPKQLHLNKCTDSIRCVVSGTKDSLWIPEVEEPWFFGTVEEALKVYATIRFAALKNELEADFLRHGASAIFELGITIKEPQ